MIYKNIRKERMIQMLSGRRSAITRRPVPMKIVPMNIVKTPPPTPPKQIEPVLFSEKNTKKYTVRLLYDVPGWAYYWQCEAMKKYAPDDFDVTIGGDYMPALKQKKHDLVLQMCYSNAKELRKSIDITYPKTVLVSIYSVGWNYNNDWLTGCINDSDYVICNNYEMWDKYGKHPKTFTISNGVDFDKFYIQKPIEKRKQKVLWIGSMIHRKVKNYDSIILPLKKMLDRDRIESDFRLVDSCGKNRMDQKQMCDWYQTGTIYIVPSSSEGTPNPLIEASACGCIPVSTRVGNAIEMIENGVNGYLCDTNALSLYKGIKSTIPNYLTMSKNMQETIKEWGWKERSEQYFDLFRKLIDERRSNVQS